MSYSEDELLPISALQHLAFCERQAALIHIEGLWEDNRLTVEGEQLHERVHTAGDEARGDLRIARGLRLRSLKLGLTGVADLVEFHRSESIDQKTSVELPGVAGRWCPFIVEYKRGRPKMEREDEVQLCAQAICLEEMLGVKLETSAFFYGQPRRRQQVNLDDSLREETSALALRLHRMIAKGFIPPPEYASRCQRCSLVDLCLPKLERNAGKVERYLLEAIRGEETK